MFGPNRAALALLLASSLLACSQDHGARPPATTSDAALVPAATASAAPPTDAAQSSQPVGVADKHFSGEIAFDGPCARGGRGGCYRFVFLPDGTVKFWMLDAMGGGTYEVDGDKLRFTMRKGMPTDADVVVTYVTRDGFRTFTQEGVTPSEDTTFHRSGG